MVLIAGPNAVLPRLAEVACPMFPILDSSPARGWRPRVFSLCPLLGRGCQTCWPRIGIVAPLVNRARCIALFSGRWSAEKQQLFGLLLGQFRLQRPLFLFICQNRSCNETFPDLRTWSQHAFKVHGRIRNERWLIEGKQCPICFQHYAVIERLCNHLRHTRALIVSMPIVQPTIGWDRRSEV